MTNHKKENQEIVLSEWGRGPTAYFIPGRVGWGVGPRQIRVCRLSSVCLSVVCLSPPRDPPATHPNKWVDPWIDPGSIQDRSRILSDFI